MAYTIKGLAKANECETHDAYGLACVWNYWYTCNCGGRKTIMKDFMSLRKSERQDMLDWLQMEDEYFRDLLGFIVSNLY